MSTATVHDTIVKALAGAIVGGLLSWSATALTLTGRVTAIEQSLLRIELRLGGPLPAATAAPTSEPPKP